MSCLYSTACVYGVTALAVAIWLIPLLIILWLWRKTHIRRNWVPLFFFPRTDFFDPRHQRIHRP